MGGVRRDGDCVDEFEKRKTKADFKYGYTEGLPASEAQRCTGPGLNEQMTTLLFRAKSTYLGI